MQYTDLSQTAWTVSGSNQRDRCSGGNAEDPLDELDLTENISLRANRKVWSKKTIH
jgi:hypothetical protein